MKSERLLFTLTALNFLLLVFLFAQMRPVEANTASSVLRGRSLEIVDDRGRVRASIKVHAADENFPMPDGSKGYPETVVLRLIDPNGRPEVKIAASVEGAGIGLVGEADSTQVQLVAKGAQASLRLKNKEGPELLLKP
jgi:hypothetical protein